MINLHKYIKESLLDDEDEIMTSAETSMLNKEVQEWIGDEYEVTNDKKYIMTRSAHHTKIYFGDLDIKLSELNKLNSRGLKFQPIKEISISDRNVDDYLKNIHIEGCGKVYITPDFNKGIDFNKMNFDPIFIDLAANYWNLIAPKKHVPYVFLRKTRWTNEDSDWENVKDWDCDVLILSTAPFENWNDGKYTIGDFDKEKLQILVNNNPKAKQILLYDNAFNSENIYKINTSGAKRKITSVVKRKVSYVDFIYDEVDKYNETVVKDFEKKYGYDKKPIRLR